MENTQAAPAANETFTQVFRFKAQPRDKFLRELTEDRRNDAEFMERYEEGTDEFGNPTLRRKPVTLELPLPQWIASIPEADRKVVADLLKSGIATYVRETYINEFREHEAEANWENVRKHLESVGAGRAKQWTYSDASLKAAAASFGEFMSAALNNVEAGARMKATAEAKFSPAAFQSNLQGFDSELVGKVSERVDDWYDHLQDQLEELPEETASDIRQIAEHWNQTFERHLKRLEEKEAIDFKNIL